MISVGLCRGVASVGPYVVDMRTGVVSGGPVVGVQHYHRETGELESHEYGPETCEKCAEIAEKVATMIGQCR